MQHLHPFRSRSLSPPNKVARCQQQASSLLQQQEQHVCSTGGQGGPSQYQNLQEKLVQLTRLVKDGQVEAIEKLVNEVDSSFFDEHPELLFSLRRCRFLYLLDAGDTAQALAHARTELTPMAESRPVLLPMVKAATALLLASASEREPPQVALQSAVCGLQTALRTRSGFRGPALVRLLQARRWSALLFLSFQSVIICY